MTVTAAHKSSKTCRYCNGTNVICRHHEDSDGHEDYEYTCDDCKKVWWIDGIDS